MESISRKEWRKESYRIVVTSRILRRFVANKRKNLTAKIMASGWNFISRRILRAIVIRIEFYASIKEKTAHYHRNTCGEKKTIHRRIEKNLIMAKNRRNFSKKAHRQAFFFFFFYNTKVVDDYDSSKRGSVGRGSSKGWYIESKVGCDSRRFIALVYEGNLLLRRSILLAASRLLHTSIRPSKHRSAEQHSTSGRTRSLFLGLSRLFYPLRDRYPAVENAI